MQPHVMVDYEPVHESGLFESSAAAAVDGNGTIKISGLFDVGVPFFLCFVKEVNKFLTIGIHALIQHFGRKFPQAGAAGNAPASQKLMIEHDVGLVGGFFIGDECLSDEICRESGTPGVEVET